MLKVSAINLERLAQISSNSEWPAQISSNSHTRQAYPCSSDWCTTLYNKSFSSYSYLCMVVVKRIYRIFGYPFVGINSNEYFAERIFDSMHGIQPTVVCTLRTANPAISSACMSRTSRRVRACGLSCLQRSTSRACMCSVLIYIIIHRRCTVTVTNNRNITTYCVCVCQVSPIRALSAFMKAIYFSVLLI